MRIERYGLHLETLKAAHLEQVRQWRNADHVRTHMDHQEPIGLQAQQRWFVQLDPGNNLYLIISVADTPIGVVNLKAIDWTRSVGEAGIFIGSLAHLNTTYPMLAVLALMDLAFYWLQMQRLRAKVHAKALDFNTRLGYRPEQPDAPSPFPYYTVDQKTYLASAQALRTTAGKMHGPSTVFHFEGDTDHFWKDCTERMPDSHRQALDLRIA
ncbi:MAG: GNAT family N-acetyltransferase [Bacteroidota bacterium]